MRTVPVCKSAINAQSAFVGLEHLPRIWIYPWTSWILCNTSHFQDYLIEICYQCSWQKRHLIKNVTKGIDCSSLDLKETLIAWMEDIRVKWILIPVNEPCEKVPSMFHLKSFCVVVSTVAASVADGTFKWTRVNGPYTSRRRSWKYTKFHESSWHSMNIHETAQKLM